MSDRFQLYCRDSTEIFLEKESIDLFFINPSYVGSSLEEYKGPLDSHINNVKSIEEYLSHLIKTAKHLEHALSQDGSAFIMLQNQHNVVPRFCHLVEQKTGLKVGQLFVWDFSSTEFLQDLNYEKMGLIVHLHKGSFYLNQSELEYVIKLPFNPNTIKKYEPIGFIGSTLPEGLYERFILAFSKEGDTVADIFGGTGTAAVATLRLGRKAVYNDIAPQQYAITAARILDLENSGA